MSQNNAVLETRGITKKYGFDHVVNNVDLQIYKGECFGILGPNGAGKTTIMRMMYCHSPITSGDAFVLGLNAKAHRKEIKARIGVVPQDDGLDPDFSVFENLLIYSSYFKIPKQLAKDRSMELLRGLKLEDTLDKQVHTLSGGMRRRLTIARSLINNPEVLFLDEPTTGLDPQVRQWIWDFLENLKSQGVTLILTTHYMEEAEKLCNRIALMDKGQLLDVDLPAALIKKHVGIEVVEVTTKEQDINYLVNKLKKSLFNFLVTTNKIYVYIHEGQDHKAAMDLIFGESLTVRKSCLNDVFLKLAGHELKQEV